MEERILDLEEKQSEELSQLDFGPSVHFVYNPLLHASQPHEMYVKKYCRHTKKVLFLGMNPGPFGMVQTGVPFGEVESVKNYLMVSGTVFKPPKEHPKRPVDGFACTRSEVSGKRLWGLMRNLTSGDPEKLFRNCYLHNYCPLAFMGKNGANITPPSLKKSNVRQVEKVCDKFLVDVIRTLEVEIVVGIGKYSADRTKSALKHAPDSGGLEERVRVESILHPSPINPAANKSPGWESIARQQLLEMGVLDVIV